MCTKIDPYTPCQPRPHFMYILARFDSELHVCSVTGCDNLLQSWEQLYWSVLLIPPHHPPPPFRFSAHLCAHKCASSWEAML